jgi:hypothetical protein
VATTHSREQLTAADTMVDSLGDEATTALLGS